ncbi:MAG: polyribonucleotide nucleotidyltransferase, partial [Chitinophagales bacterium]|nr:polyribonucleotide nucleotidyltransferase [Chitinophagales bacterium]
MKPNPITKTIDLGGGKIISIETGKLAKQADGSVVVRCGETMLLATVVSAKEAKAGVDFMPLTVDYRENYASAGRLPGGFLKREARPSEYEILISRLIDRAMRPMFPNNYHAETQVLVTLISLDKEILPDALACFAAAGAMAVSDVPFNGPISEVRVGRVNGNYIINPTRSELALSDIDMIVAGSHKDVVMVEGEMKEITEDDMLEAIRLAHQAIQMQCEALSEFSKMAGKETKREYNHETHDEDLRARMWRELYDKVSMVAHMPSKKEERHEAFKKVKEEFTALFTEEELAEKGGFISTYYHDIEKHAMREMILTDKQRLDGRKMDEIRDIWCEV